ncbi:unnamed protein product [Pelagomonas calceolata]|uniref:Uncharacterized protein n=1 Tax=Pelagomonas calceolata TaxID=35677 RepID=A0A8J2SAK8_9STRA|nr:unnamed protein product [Pelagomonas calceolata]
MGNRRLGSRALAQVQRAKRDHKRRHDTVDASTVVAAAPRARKRARRLAQKDAVEETVQAADLESQLNLAKWVDRGIPLKTLEEVIDPESEEEFALLAAALRSGKPLAKFREQVERSRRRVERDKKLRAAGAALRDKDGFSTTYVQRVLNAAGGVTLREMKVVQTGAQARAKRKRDRAVAARPANLRPSYETQTAAPGNNPSIKSRKGDRSGGVRLHPETKRPQAEINAQAQRVTGPYARGTYQMKIPKSLFSNKALARMGFRPTKKPKRLFSFSGPTAKDDARAFDKKLMGWLKKWKKGVGSPPQP